MVLHAEAMGDISAGERSVMGLEDLHGGFMGVGHDYGLETEPDEHERAVGATKLGEGDVGCLV